MSKIDFKRQSKGAILIEFAFCIPVLILIIYYMHDLFLLQRYYSQTEFVAYQAVQMIQAISQNRSSKAITASDLKYICAASFLSIYPGTTQFWQGKGHPLGHFPIMEVYYVKGLDNGNASCIWRVNLHHNRSVTSPLNRVCREESRDSERCFIVRYKTDVPPSQIYPTLKIKPKEVKVILEVFLYYSMSSYWPYSDGRYGVHPREAFGFYLITPKYLPVNSSLAENTGYFHSVVIFSPNPDLFTTTAPQ